MPIALRYAARSDVGLLRSNNQDSGYAGPHLLVVADGMGGHAGGDIASSLAIGELAALDGESHGSDDALAHLAGAVRTAHADLLDRVAEEPYLCGMGTTVTALLRTGNRLALAHIGDSRAYLLRDGMLVQITRDHTFVQSLVDDGRLTPEEAEHHPQRHVIIRVLSDVVTDTTPDLSMRETHIGDRYLLCSDGLSGVVSHETLEATLCEQEDPGAACEALVQLALRAGAPDNVTCVVADVVDAGAITDTVPVVVGAASLRQPARRGPVATSSAAERAAALTAPPVDAEPEPERPRRRRVVLRLLALCVVVAGVTAAGAGTWSWVNDQYYVGSANGSVAVFRGLPQSIGPLSLSSVQQTYPDLPVTHLPRFWRDRVSQGIEADNLAETQKILTTLRQQAQTCLTTRRPTVTTTTRPAVSSPSSTLSPNSPHASGSTSAATKPTPSSPATSRTVPYPAATPTRAATSPAGAATTTTTAPAGATDCDGLG